MVKQNTIDQLNRLVQVNRDAQAGLLSAAKEVKNSEIETLFDGIAKQHAKFVAELEAEIEHQGGSLENASSSPVGDAVHRGWAGLKAVLSGNSAHSLLASCEDGEQSAEVSYTDAINDNPAGRIHTLTSKHLHQIQEFRSRLTRLLHITEDGAGFPRNER